MLVLFTMSYINIVLNIITTLYEGYIVSVHRMVLENRRPVDPRSIQGSHRPIFFMIKRRTRADDIFNHSNRSYSQLADVFQHIL